MKVSELIEHLKTLPQDKTVVCQVVPQEVGSGAWNMRFEFADAPRSDWMVVLSVSHPDLLRLSPEIKFGPNF